jgi:ubiquinone/menaquinone biosynthesis C-methylase UbiE
VQNFKQSHSNKDKISHYKLVERYFRESAINKGGYYDAKNKEKFKHDAQQLKIWEICTSILDKILQNNPKTMKVIDVGCGIGDFTQELAKRYPQFNEIIGIDSLKEVLEIAKKNAMQFDRVSFTEGNVLDIPFNDRNFDVTICINLLHHIHIDDFERAIGELARITDKYLILEIRNKEDIFNFWYDRFLIPIYYKDLPVNTNTVSEVSDIIKNHGFKLRTVKGLFPFKRICRRLILFYERIDAGEK